MMEISRRTCQNNKSLSICFKVEINGFKSTIYTTTRSLIGVCVCVCQALQLQPGDRNCLVARSRCYVKMGEAINALKDAEASLKNKKKFFKVGSFFLHLLFLLQSITRRHQSKATFVGNQIDFKPNRLQQLSISL